MRTPSLLLCFLLGASALAFAPNAAADPACTTDLCGPFPPGPSCLQKTYALPTGAQDTLEVHADCSATLETGKGQVCVGAWSGYEERQIGPLLWKRHYCESPGGNPLCCITVSSDSGSPEAIPPCQCPPPPALCQPVNRILAPGGGNVRYELDDHCHLKVIVDLSDGCGLQGKEWTNNTFNPVSVDYHHCQSPPPQEQQSSGPSPSMADPFPECFAPCAPGPNACDLEAATPTSVGPYAGVDPRTSLWGTDEGCDIDVDPIGAWAPPSGNDVDRDVAFVHVHILLCGGNPPPIWA